MIKGIPASHLFLHHLALPSAATREAGVREWKCPPRLCCFLPGSGDRHRRRWRPLYQKAGSTMGKTKQEVEALGEEGEEDVVGRGRAAASERAQGAPAEREGRWVRSCTAPTAAKAPSGWTLQLRRGQQGTGHRRLRKPRALAGLGAGALELRAPVGSARPEEMQPPGEAEPVWGTAVEEPARVPVPRGSPCFKATHARPSRGGGCSKAAHSAPGWEKRRALTKNKLADRVRRSKRPPQISKGRLHNPSLLPNGASLHFYRVARV